MFLRNACAHIPHTRLHDVKRHSKIFRRGHNVRKLWELFAVRCGTVQRGAEGHMHSTQRQEPVGLAQCKTLHVAYDAVWSGDVTDRTA